MIRLFDILFSALGLVVLSPLFLILYVLIRCTSKGPGFFIQERIGLGGKPFGLYKFRSMRTDSESEGLITIGEHDNRITRIGHFIRKYKLDELPQLLNVLKGDMSLVGPRPEVRRYVELYTDEQRKVLDVKPGITDYASIEYVNENELLGDADDPDRVYVEQVMPNKLKLNMKYIQNKSLTEYFKIIFLTLKSIASISIFNKLINWYFNRKSLPFWGIFLMDCAIVYGSFLFVYQQFNSGKDALYIIERLTLCILTYLVFYIIGFRIFRTYSGILRYSSFVDLKKVGYATLWGLLLSEIAHFLLCGHEIYSYLTPIQILVATILATFLIWLVRIGVKTVYDVTLKGIHSKYAYIYGVKNGGIAIAKHIRNENPVRFDLKGFISDDKNVEDKILMGVRVHRLDDTLLQTMSDEGIEALIVSPYRKESFLQNEALLDKLINAGIHIYLTQEAQEWDKVIGGASPQLKEVSIEDLLPRQEIVIDMKSVGEQLAGKCIMITGSAGSIGQEIVQQVCKFNPGKLILIDQAETPQHDLRLMMDQQWPEVDAEVLVASVCHQKHIESLFREYKPDYVFHAAAYKHVPMLEDNPEESVYNNIYGTRVLADLAVKYGVRKFVMISTDKAVNPSNVMGCSKRICEIYVQSLDKAIKNGVVKGVTQFVTTRFGNVLGSNGSVIPLFREQIKNGGPVTVTHPEIIRYFMLIPEACKLVLEAGTKGNGGEIFVFDMGKAVKIDDLAKRMIQLSGAKGVEIKYTGLRQGEKLYEELLDAEETTMPSFHQKIRIAKVREYDYNCACKKIDDLYTICEHYDKMATVRKMKQIVPEFKSKNSIYEELDAELDAARKKDA